jgi:hypothetical protein
MENSQDLGKSAPARRIDDTVQTHGEEITTTLERFCVSPDSKTLDIVIMAAGKGTRMKSSLPKVLHKLAGCSLC